MTSSRPRPASTRRSSPPPRPVYGRPPGGRPASFSRGEPGPYRRTGGRKPPAGLGRPPRPFPRPRSWPLPGGRRPWPRRWPRYGWGGPYPLYTGIEIDEGVVDSLPGRPAPAADLPGLERFRPAARRSLQRAGLWRRAWRELLAGADESLVDFVNTFHRTAGFEALVRANFGPAEAHWAARLALRMARRFAARRPESVARLRFEPALALAAGGHTYQGVDLALGWRRYQFRPWPRLERRSLERQLRRDMALHAGPQDVRWVFSGRRLGLDRREATRQARRLLADLQRDPAARRWIDALDQVVIVV